MAIERQTKVYDGPGGPFEGVFAHDAAAAAQRPGVLILPNVLGQKEADNWVAERMAGVGYVGFVADVFGQGKRAERGPDMGRYMNECLADRAQLRDRLAASLATLKAHPAVDAAKTAAIGFCFGGLCVLDLARSGQDVLGGVSFHGVFHRPDYANVSPIAMKLLVSHGWDDPLAKPDAVVALAAELTEGKADWQLHAFGDTGHGFTDESAAGLGVPGVGYQPRSAARGWRAADDFLAELFG
ncbi:dienelactone hydrolase family protein [Sphingomonas sp.]|uniref:dienelactone hydrolase family protein n=1 Tax=Sphingomonas sp. TaxID=28214 RepID=UPI003CC6C795